MTQEVVVMRGVPGSGKTLWARAYASLHPEYRRVNRDDLRMMLDEGRYSPEHEQLIRAVRDACIVEALKQGFSVIVDDTNLTLAHVESVVALAAPYNVPVRCMILDTPIEECIARDARRPRPIGPERIRAMAQQLKASLLVIQDGGPDGA